MNSKILIIDDEKDICFLISNPFKQSETNESPSLKGIPIELEYSNGAAPVPPSPPSTAMKSGKNCYIIIALHIAINSTLLPTHNLNPTGFPSDNFLILSIKSISSVGVVNAV